MYVCVGLRCEGCFMFVALNANWQFEGGCYIVLVLQFLLSLFVCAVLFQIGVFWL